jgi:dTDP-L-rhamnose 4-epimerase
VPTRESDSFSCTSVYAVTKMTQESLVLNIGAAYGIPTVSLRPFNVLGPGQSLSNPYTGVASIFMSRFKSGRRPAIYEDGRQTRDFVSVHDVVRACRLALDQHHADGRALNVGSGAATPVLRLAELLAGKMETRMRPQVLRKFRSGDIRHCFGDLTQIGKSLGYRPEISPEDALGEFVEWATSRASKDSFDRAQKELTRRGLV